MCSVSAYGETCQVKLIINVYKHYAYIVGLIGNIYQRFSVSLSLYLSLAVFLLALRQLFGHSCIAIAVIQTNFTLTMEKRIKDLTVAMILPPCAQLPIPYTVQPID